MGFFKKLIELLKNLFSETSVEAKQRHEFKRLETEFRTSELALYRNGILLPAFAEAVNLLYQHVKPIDEILNATLNARDIKIARYFETALFITAFDDEMHELYAALDYEKRIERIRSAQNQDHVYDEQRHKFDLFIRKLSGDQFIRIDMIIAQLQRLSDLCKINFVGVLNFFDPNFQAYNSSYIPKFQSIPLADAEPFLKEIYRLTADNQITEGMARAVTALETIRRRAEADNSQIENEVMEHLKKIHSVTTHILSADNALKLTRLLKTDLTLVLGKARYSSAALQTFSSTIRETFEADVLRIRTEIQNETVASQIKELFDNMKPHDVSGYNQVENSFLQQNTSLSFQWTVPVQVLKSFILRFFDERAQTLLNDVAIEGFFNSQEFKTEFSSLVYNCCDIPAKIRDFENKFNMDGENYSTLIRSYVTDSRRDESFLNTLTKLVGALNTDAKKLLTSNCKLLADLYIRLTGIFGDIKKATPDFISNVKVLFSSTRNRDKAEYLEIYFPKWNIFFEIMHDYGIIIPPIRG
jgi:hypothetical protein